MVLVRRIIKTFFFLIVSAVWAVVGLVFWVALLFRAVTVFTFTFLHAMVTGQEARSISDSVDSVSDVWFRGFRSAYEAVFGPTPSQPFKADIDVLLTETVWTTICVFFAVVLILRPNHWLWVVIPTVVLVIAAFAYGMHIGDEMGRKNERKRKSQADQRED